MNLLCDIMGHKMKHYATWPRFKWQGGDGYIRITNRKEWYRCERCGKVETESFSDGKIVIAT